MESFDTIYYVEYVRELDQTGSDHDKNILFVLNVMIRDGAPVWAIIAFLNIVF